MNNLFNYIKYSLLLFILLSSQIVYGKVWLEMGSLGMDAFTEQMIKRSAKEAFDIADHTVSKEVKDELAKVAGEVDDLETLLSKWDNLTIREAKSLYNKLSKSDVVGSKTIRTQAEILEEIKASNSLINPYNFAYPIEDITLSQEALFVRVHNSWNPNRPWLIAIEDFQKFTSQDDMIQKLALPILDDTGNIIRPTQISIVKVPAGTKVRKSIARPQDWPGQGHQPGGSIQFEIRDQRAEREWFKSIGNVNDYIN